MSELNSDPNVSAEEIERETAKLRQISEGTAKRYARVRQNARAVNVLFIVNPVFWAVLGTVSEVDD